MNSHLLISRKNVFLILSGLFFFHLVVSYWVMSQSDIVCIYDESARQGNAYMFVGDSLSFSEKVFYFFRLDSGQGHPHFVEWVAGLVWGSQKAFGSVESWQVILGTNAVFGLVLIFSIYGLGSMIYCRQSGLLAAFMISVLPVVFSQSRVLMLDYPLMSMVTFSFYLLYKTRDFSSVRYCLLFGLAAGLTQMTKEIAVVFIGIPWIYYFAKAYVLGPRDVVMRRGLASAVVYAVIVGSVYFLPHNFHVFLLYRAKAGMFSAGLSPVYYLHEIDKLVGYGVFFLSIPFLLSYLMKMKSRDLFLFFWFFVVGAILSFSPNKSPRFLLPLLPAFALIVSGEAVRHLRSGFWGAVGCGVLIVVLSVQFFSSNVSFGNSGYSDPASDGRPTIQWDGNSSSRKQLIDSFQREYLRTGFIRRSTVVPLFNAPHIVDFLRIEFISKGMPFILEQPLQYDLSDFRGTRWGNRPDRILQADYVLMDVGGVPGRVPGNPLEKVLTDGFNEYKDCFEKTSEIYLNKGSRIDVYKKRAGVP